MLERMYGITPQEELPPPTPEVPDLAITIQENEEAYGRFVAEPLERGWGVTLGNPMRRSLLNSLAGTAVTWVKIDGVHHEYSTVPHMREEVVEFLLNVKGIRLRSLADRPGRLRLEVDGEGEVRAGDIMATADFEIVNPEHHLATLDSGEARLSVEFNVEQGVGYEPASHDEGLPIGVLPVDAIYTPVRKANFAVESTRVGQRSDLERLVIEVWTDRTITPLEAMQSAGNLLMERFFLFTRLDKEPEEETGPEIRGLSPEIFNTLVETLALSARTLNCLKRAGINRVGEVLLMPKSELLKIRNFGQKSLDELYDKLAEKEYLPDEDLEDESADGGDGPDGDDSPKAAVAGDDAGGSGDDSSEA
ncbi:MAG: DNA-directed RNA polymerase subunit alpha [Dehalococcoidia bacterium]|mgnify:CR=1 FL=1|jgi:DNA-directed RNA polymerase subunit alpha|nr:DNA-directed RNA polymerase subunit alpha [Dehalococcoidia bacterium]